MAFYLQLSSEGEHLPPQDILDDPRLSLSVFIPTSDIFVVICTQSGVSYLCQCGNFVLVLHENCIPF